MLSQIRIDEEKNKTFMKKLRRKSTMKREKDKDKLELKPASFSNTYHEHLENEKKKR